MVAPPGFDDFPQDYRQQRHHYGQAALTLTSLLIVHSKSATRYQALMVLKIRSTVENT
ncbi:MAG: hypothetical protein AB1589_05545 [Cyanobacteriota bacterium]